MNNHEDDNIVVLCDEDGNNVEFEILDLVDYEGEEYVILLSTEGDGDEVVILKSEEDENGEEDFYGVEDDEVLEAVFNIFKNRFSDEFDFAE